MTMMKLNLFLLLTASAIVATCFSVVSAGSTNGDLVALTFEPPLAFTSYPGAGCSPGDDGTSYPGHVTDIQMISYGQFCITDLVVDDSGDETTTTTTTTTPMVNAYTLIDQVTCTPWGIFERYSTCTDATCSDCQEPEAVAVSSWDEVDTDVYEGQCFDYTYSFDPTSFIGDLYPVGFSFDEGADMDDVAAYLELFNANSCVADGQYGSSSNSNSAPVTDDDDDDLSECQSIPDLLCDTAGFTVLCDLLTVWVPEWYETASSTDTDTWTLFAPDDVAFATIADDLANMTDSTIADIVLFHATKGKLTSEDLVCGGLLEMAAGGNSRTACVYADGDIYETGDILQVVQKGGGNRKNNILPVVDQTNIMACNGIIHFVSEVMLPNFVPEF